MDLRNKRISFFTILFAEFIDYAGISLVYPLFTYMLFNPGLNFLPSDTPNDIRGLWLGILIAIYPFFQFLCAPIFGALSDQKGRKKILQITIGLSLVSYIIALFSCWLQSFFLLALFRICAGIAAGNCSVISAIVADLSTAENKAKNYGLLNMAFGTGFTVGPFISGILASQVHLSAPFFAAIFLVTLNGCILIWKFKETFPGRSKSKVNFLSALAQIKKAILMKELRFLFLGLLVFSFGWSCFSEFSGLFLMHKYHFSLDAMGIYYAYNGFLYAFSAGFLITPFIRWLKEKILFLSMLLSGGYLAFFIFIDNSKLLWFYLPTLQFFLSFVYPAVCTAISNRVSVKRQGEAMGMYQGIIALAFSITPFCGGIFVGSMPSIVMMVSATCMILAAFVNVFLKDERIDQAVINDRN